MYTYTHIYVCGQQYLPVLFINYINKKQCLVWLNGTCNSASSLVFKAKLLFVYFLMVNSKTLHVCVMAAILLTTADCTHFCPHR